MLDRFASLKDAPAKDADKATDRVDLRFEFFKMQRQTGFALDVLDRGKAIDLPGRSATAHDHRPGLVVLVFDLADNAFDEVFEANHATCAAICVDDDGDVDAGGLHRQL